MEAYSAGALKHTSDVFDLKELTVQEYMIATKINLHKPIFGH
jgi:hypothetical protein